MCDACPVTPSMRDQKSLLIWKFQKFSVNVLGGSTHRNHPKSEDEKKLRFIVEQIQQKPVKRAGRRARSARKSQIPWKPFRDMLDCLKTVSRQSRLLESRNKTTSAVPRGEWPSDYRVKQRIPGHSDYAAKCLVINLSSEAFQCTA
jgi:hypothetical protein